MSSAEASPLAPTTTTARSPVAKRRGSSAMQWKVVWIGALGLSESANGERRRQPATRQCRHTRRDAPSPLHALLRLRPPPLARVAAAALLLAIGAWHEPRHVTTSRHLLRRLRVEQAPEHFPRPRVPIPHPPVDREADYGPRASPHQHAVVGLGLLLVLLLLVVAAPAADRGVRQRRHGRGREGLVCGTMDC